MDENNVIKPMKKEEQTQTMNKRISHKPSLFNKTFIQNNDIQIPQNDINNKTNDNFERNSSLINILSNKSHFVEPKDFKVLPDINSNKGKPYINNKLIQNKRNTKYNFTISHHKKPFYLTASINPIIEKKEINKTNVIQKINENENKNNNIIDLIHEKEIQICQNLIKTLPEKIKSRNKKIIRNINNEETANLIKLIKIFNIDNINTQRIIEHQILNNNNHYYNLEFNPLLSTLSLSMSTNYRTNNIPFNNFYKFNASNYTSNKNLNTSSITLKNNNSMSIIKNINDNNNSFIIRNRDLSKTKVTKSLNNKINYYNKVNNFGKIIYDPKNEINFHTGFVRSQKNIYDDVYSKYFKNNKKNEIRIKNYRRKKEEANKLTLPEIEEYKSIIKEIENRKKRALRKSQSVINIHKEKNDIVLKDQLVEELNNIYLGQKNTFLNNLKNNNFKDDHQQMEVDSYYKEINENIRNINKIKREPNSFVDGYSLFDGTINKKLKEYNYILGNKFHDKEQKEEKAEKFHEIYEEYENKIKNNKKELLNEKNAYKQIFIQKIDFNKDKNKEDSINKEIMD